MFRRLNSLISSYKKLKVDQIALNKKYSACFSTGTDVASLYSTFIQSRLCIEDGTEEESQIGNVKKKKKKRKKIPLHPNAGLLPMLKPYPSYKATISIKKFIKQYNHLVHGAREENEVHFISGRVTSKREAGSKLVFMDINSENDKVQVLAELGFFTGDHDVESRLDMNASEQFNAMMHVIRRGDIVGIHGFAGKSGKGELSIIPTNITLLAPCRRNLPLSTADSLKDINTRYRHRHIDFLVNPLHKSVFYQRATLLRTLRNFLDRDGYCEVETPLLTSTGGGAAARPFKTKSNVYGDLTLRIAPELYLKQLVIGGFDRVYELGRVFRNEGATHHHNPEFTMLEFYQAYGDVYSMMSTVENILRECVLAVNDGDSKISVQLLNKYSTNNNNNTNENEGSKTNSGNMTNVKETVVIDFTEPFKRISICPALEEKLGVKLPNFDDLDNSAKELKSLCESYDIKSSAPFTVPRLLDDLIGHFLEPECIQPTFLCDHPTVMSPLAKEYEDAPHITERFELFINGSEVANAYSELNNPDEQLKRFQSQIHDRNSGDVEAPQNVDEKYCEALEYGLPPTGGCGIGIDRLMMLLCGRNHIRNVLLFPTMNTPDKSD